MSPRCVHFMIKIKQPTSKHTILSYTNLSSNIPPPPPHACVHAHTHTCIHATHRDLLEAGWRQLEVLGVMLGVRDREKVSLELWLRLKEKFEHVTKRKGDCSKQRDQWTKKVDCPWNCLCLFTKGLFQTEGSMNKKGGLSLKLLMSVHKGQSWPSHCYTAHGPLTWWPLHRLMILNKTPIKTMSIFFFLNLTMHT